MNPKRYIVPISLCALCTSLAALSCSSANSPSGAGTNAFGTGGFNGGGAGNTGIGNTGNFGSGNTGNTGSGDTGNTGSGDTGNTGVGGGGGGGGNAGGATSITVDGGGTFAIDPVGTKNRAPGFVNLAPPMGDPFSETEDTVTTPSPTGWKWHNVDGAICRDGSPTGVYIHEGTANKLVVYLEGGGACSNDHYCAFNPKNDDQVLAGDGRTVLGSAVGATAGHQMPGVYTNNTGVQGMFDTSNAANPYKDWNIVYIPYCTGDVFFGTATNSHVPFNVADPGPQQFVGYNNMKLMMGRIVPTFKDKVDHVILTGASAGGFGAALNASMVSDSFGDVPVDIVDDSGPPFDDQYMPVCMQKNWRAQWGLNGAFPPDCTECRDADGGGLVNLAGFLLRKHPKAHIAMISTMQDEVIRLFYSVGLVDCKNYNTGDPVAVTLGQADPTVFFPGQQYTDGLNALKAKYVGSGQMATYFMGGTAPDNTYHQHVFRSEFYVKGGANPSDSVETEADFVGKFITASASGGTMEQVGP